MSDRFGELTFTGPQVQKFHSWQIVTREQLGIGSAKYDRRPIHGPDLPDEYDKVQWLIATLDLTPQQAEAMELLEAGYRYGYNRW